MKRLLLPLLLILIVLAAAATVGGLQRAGASTLPGDGGQPACTSYNNGQQIHGWYWSYHIGVLGLRYGYHQCAAAGGIWVYVGNW